MEQQPQQQQQLLFEYTNPTNHQLQQHLMLLSKKQSGHSINLWMEKYDTAATPLYEKQQHEIEIFQWRLLECF